MPPLARSCRSADVSRDVGPATLDVTEAFAARCAMALPSAGGRAVDLDVVREVAKQAAIYGLPSVIQYRTMWLQALDASSPSYVGLGAWQHPALPTAEDRDIVGASRDTLYLYAWLDLRAEPWVMTVPPISPEGRYYTAQWDDMNGHVIDNVSPFADGYAGGDFLIAGPGWDGDLPGGVRRMLTSETSIVVCLARVEVMGEHDLAAADAIRDGFALRPLSSYLDRSAPAAAPLVQYPPYTEGLYQSGPAEFFDLVAFLLQFAQPDPVDQPVLDRMATIGIIPGASWTEGFGADHAQREAAMAGLHDAIELMQQIATGAVDLGSRAAHPLYGTRATMRDHYTHLAFGAWSGVFGNVAEHAAYRGWRRDADGDPIDGSKHNYTITLSHADQSQSRFFWSVTMYELPDPFLYANAAQRYSISGRDQRPTRDADGSLTLYLQHDDPGPVHQANWLPAPAGPFLVAMRLYGPSEAVQTGDWDVPPMRKYNPTPIG